MSNGLHLFKDWTMQESLGSKKISNLTKFYFKNKFITQDEQKFAKKIQNNWPLFQEKILKSRQRQIIDTVRVKI